MKKFLVLVCMAAVLSLTLVACANKTETSDVQKSEKKVIKVGMEVAYPPFEYYKEDQTTITGLDYDLANAIGKELGYEMEFIDTPWDEIFTSFDEGKFDIVMSAITITDERKGKYDFSTPYIQNYQCIVTRSTAKIKPNDMSMLNNLKIGCLTESTSSTYLDTYIKENNIKVEKHDYDVMLDAFTDLKDVKLHAVVCDSTLADQYCKDESYLMSWKDTKEPEEFAICFPKGSKYVKEFNTAIDTLKKNGELEKILATYLGK